MSNGTPLTFITGVNQRLFAFNLDSVVAQHPTGKVSFEAFKVGRLGLLPFADDENIWLDVLNGVFDPAGGAGAVSGVDGDSGGG